jgi:hypothetical protein
LQSYIWLIEQLNIAFNMQSSPKPRNLLNLIPSHQRFHFWAPDLTSPTHFLNLPVEVRQRIFSNLLQVESLDFLEPHPQTALPFERPVVYIHDRSWLRWARSQGSDSYWGGSRMSRLFTINRQIYEEMVDLLYSQFAFFIVPWNMGNQNINFWRWWLSRVNPEIIQRIHHYHLCITLNGSPNCYAYSKACPGKPDWTTELKIDECRDLVNTFPNLKSVALQIQYDEALLNCYEIDPLFYARQIVLLANFWREKNIRVMVFSAPCMGRLGRRIILAAQDMLQQKQIWPNMMTQSKTCSVYQSIDLGCGLEKCLDKRDKYCSLPDEEYPYELPVLQWNISRRSWMESELPNVVTLF